MTHSGAVPAQPVRLTGLTRRFGAAVAANGVSLTVPPGRRLGVIGRSGAGKGTLSPTTNRPMEPNGGVHRGAPGVTALRGRALRDRRADGATILQRFNPAPGLRVLTGVPVGRLNRRGAPAGPLDGRAA